MTNPTYKAHGFSSDAETDRRLAILARWLDRPISWVIRSAVNQEYERWAITDEGRKALEAEQKKQAY